MSKPDTVTLPRATVEEILEILQKARADIYRILAESPKGEKA